MNAAPHLSQPQISHSFVPPSQQYQSHMDHQTSYVPQIAYHSTQVSTQPMSVFPQLDSRLAVLVFTQGDPINEATIQNGRVTVQQVQGRQGQSYANTVNKGNATSSGGNNIRGQSGLLNAIIVKVKDTGLGNALSLRGQGTLHGILDDQAAQTTIPNNVAFQTKDLDAYDFDCDDVSNAKAVLMANLSNYGLDVISVVPHLKSYHNDLDNESVHFMQDIKQTPIVDFPYNEIISDSNIIPYSQYLQETQQAAIQDTNLYAQQDSMILSMIEQMSEQIINHGLNIDLSTREKMIDSQMDDTIKEKFTLKQQIDSREQNLSNQIKEKESLLQTFTVFKNDSKEKEMHMLIKPQVFYDDTHKQDLGYQNPFYLKKARRIKPTLYNGSGIYNQHAVIHVIDDEETSILEEFDILPVKIEAPRELPMVSLVNTSLKKLKNHLGKFNVVVKKRITPDAITEGEWGFEHTKAIFLNEIISFLKTLKDTFNVFDKDFLNEVMKIQTVFNQMEAVVQQCSVDKQCFEIHKKLLFLDNNRLLHQIISQEVMLTVMNSNTVDGDSVNMEIQSSESYDKCFNLDAELLKKTKWDKSCDNQNSLEIPKYFENNDLKAQLQAKDTTIRKLKNHIKSMRKNDKDETVKHDMDEIETINIELEHSVAKLLFENELLHKEIEHLKKNYKDQFDSIKRTRACSKEHSDSLIAQLNSKSMEIADLKGFKSFTCVSGSQLTGNKNDRISQTPSSNMKNKGEDHPRSVIQIVLWYLESECSKHMIGDCSQLMNFVSKFLGTIRFGNDQIVKIMGYGDYQLGNNLDGVDLLLGSKDTNLFTISLDDMLKTSLICLLSKASKAKSWLWHRRLSYLNFACALGKNKKSSHQPKAKDTNQEKLYLLHMDLCGLIRVESINGKKYILVIVDDYL
ncbi:hypothetical protein Tco_1367639 [Tanacetum coccineum]